MQNLCLHFLNQIAQVEPGVLAPRISDFVAALDNREAQTRWECLDALSALVPFDSRACDKAVNGAEVALFDEDSLAPCICPRFGF